MKVLFHFEITRLVRSKLLFLELIFILLAGAMGFILDYVFYDGIGGPSQRMMSIFNTFTQFNFLLTGSLFVLAFAKDHAKGVVNYYRQMGYTLYQQSIAKTLALLLIVVPSIDIIVVVVYLVYGNINIGLLLLSLAVIDIGTVYIALLAILIATANKNVVASVLILLGSFLLLSILNLLGYGIFNPADFNSMPTYLVYRYAGLPVKQYSLDKIAAHLEGLEATLAIVVSFLDCAVLAVLNWPLMSKKRL